MTNVFNNKYQSSINKIKLIELIEVIKLRKRIKILNKGFE